MKHFLMTLAVFALLTGSVSPAQAQQPCAGMDFVVIQPGQPGGPAQAQPVLSALGEMLAEKLGQEAALDGAYCNDLEQCLPLIQERKPAWGIVSLPFYSRYGEELGMTPIAATRPGGRGKDVWRLMAHEDKPDAWRELEGDVAGTMLHLPNTASCLLFGQQAKGLPFDLVGISRPLSALRAAAQGAEGGVVLDAAQYSAVGALPQARSLKVVHESVPLPTSPVVWFGNPDERAARLSDILASLAGDPEAADLLQLLQTQGFGPPDAALEDLKTGEDDGACLR